MTTRRPTGLPRWWPVALYVLTSLAWVAPAVLSAGTFGAVDVVEQFAPYQERHADLYRTGMPIQGDQAIQLVLPAEFWQSARDGGLQLWEPDIAGGTPMGTGVWNRVLSPFHLTFAVLPARWAPTATAFLGALVAQLGTHLLARRLGLGRRGAVIAAVGYAFAGPVVAYTHRIHEAWLLPLLLAAVDGAVVEVGARGRRWAAGAGAVTAGVLLSGFPAAGLMVLYTAGGYTTARAVGLRRQGRALLGRVVTLGGAVAAGGLVASVQLLPSLEFLDATVSTVRRYGTHRIPTEMLATAPMGRFFGTLQDDDWWGPVSGNPIEDSMTAGLVLLGALALVGLLGVRSRATHRPFAVRAVAVTTVVLVHTTFFARPFLTLFQQLPLMDQTLFTRSRFIASLAIALLGAMAVERLLDRDPAGDRASWWLRAAGLYLGAVVTWGVGRALLTTEVPVPLREVAHDVWPLLVVVVVAALLLWRLPRSTVTVVALPVAVATELLVGAWGFVPTSPPGTFPEPDAATAMIADTTGPGDQYRYVDRPNLALFGHTGAWLDLKDAAAHWPVPGAYQQVFESAGDSVRAASEGKAIFEPTIGDDVPLDSPSLDAVAAGWLLQDLETGPLELDDPVVSQRWDLDGTQELEVPSDTPPLRALVVGPITEQPASCVTGWWVAEVTTETGQRVEVRRTLRNVIPPMEAVFPLPDLVAEDLTVTLRTHGPCGVEPRDAVVSLVPRRGDAVLELVGVEGWQAYRRTTALPRLSITTETEFVADADGRLDRIAGTSDRPVLTSTPTVTLDAQEASVAFVRDEPDEVSVRTTSDGTALVVLRDGDAPGWTVMVDDRPAQLVRVDHAFRGVVVPAGEHVATFRYRPRSFVLGTRLALAGTLTLLALALLPPSRRRRPD